MIGSPNTDVNQLNQQKRTTKIPLFDQVIEPEHPKVQAVKNKTKLVIVALLISLSSLYYGFVLTFMGTIPSATLKIYYGPIITDSPSTLPILFGAMPVGGLFGSLLANVVMRYFSRRNFLILVNCCALGVNLMIQITNIWVLLISRLLTGVIVGLFMGIVPIYIHEISPPSISGTVGAFTQMQHLFGNVISYFFGMIFYLCNYEGQFMMRFQYEFPSLLVIAQLIAIIFGFMPQSPNSLLMSGRIEQAKEVLRQFNEQSQIQELIREKLFENGQKQKHLEVVVQQSPTHEITKKVVEEQEKIEMTWKSYLLSFELPLTQQLTGVNFLTTQLTAITAIYNQPFSHFTALIANTIQFISTIFSGYLLSRFGRRPLILVGNVALGILTIIIGVVFYELYLNWAAGFAVGITLIFIFNAIYGLTLGPVMWLYVPEIAEKKVVPLAIATYWFGASLCVIVAPIITTIMDSPYAVFLFLGCYTMAWCVPNYFLVVETKDKTPEQINRNFHHS